VAIIAYVGNFKPEHSTENDLRRTLEDMGHEVTMYQEDVPAAWEALVDLLRRPAQVDLVLWTSTYDYSQKVGHEVQREMLYTANYYGVSTIGIHLDRWWGLQRWKRVLTEPFFQCSYVLTADGAHQNEFDAAGVTHLWSPPAIAPHNCVRGEYDPYHASDIAFVGNWAGGYHEEWQHRRQLVKHLERRWGDRVKFWPKRGHEAVRGQALANLYASVKVVVGDSCLAPKVDGTPMTHYCSDRVFETIGRGGFLVHPFVEGVLDISARDPLVAHQDHCSGWELGEWRELDDRITAALDDPLDKEQVASAGMAHVKANHTYANRLDWALGLVGL
jgi:hypothetical protein